MTLLQLHPPIPLVTPKGKGVAILVADPGSEHHLEWTVLQDSGEVWTWQNPEVRAQENRTALRLGITSPTLKAAQLEMLRALDQNGNPLDPANHRDGGGQRQTTEGLSVGAPPGTPLPLLFSLVNTAQLTVKAPRDAIPPLVSLTDHSGNVVAIEFPVALSLANAVRDFVRRQKDHPTMVGSVYAIPYGDVAL